MSRALSTLAIASITGRHTPIVSVYGLAGAAFGFTIDWFSHLHCESLVSSLHKRKYGTKRESCRRKVGRFKNMKIPHLSRNTEIATDTGFDDRSSERQKFQALRRGDQASK